uniref:Uncharacterized protein n=1 Tax=Anguilla anguilla TaxID=7936 RepID=A0A0E9W1M9_ANGAN
MFSIDTGYVTYHLETKNKCIFQGKGSTCKV